jgi:hypothetical protein
VRNLPAGDAGAALHPPVAPRAVPNLQDGPEESRIARVTVLALPRVVEGGRVTRVAPSTLGVRRVPTLDAADAPCLRISGPDLVPWDLEAGIGGQTLQSSLCENALSGPFSCGTCSLSFPSAKARQSWLTTVTLMGIGDGLSRKSLGSLAGVEQTEGQEEQEEARDGPIHENDLAANPPKEPSKAALRRERLLANHKAGSTRSAA